jgi:hypothetical protein
MARKKKDKKRRRWSTFDTLLLGAVGALVTTSVVREFRRPPAERTWRGKVLGIPYDYRPPTADRLRSTWWAPEDERLLKPTAYGLGWDLNLGRVVKLASSAVASNGARSSNGAASRR